MVDLNTVSAAIGAATSAVGLIDKMADQIERFLTKQSQPAVPTEHRLKIEKEGDAIVSKNRGEERQRITAKDLEKLPHTSLRHIKVLEQSMENHYTIWSAVYPQLALAVDPIAKAKTEQQLKEVVRSMKGDLDGILTFIEQAGMYLDDHYLHIRSLVVQA